MQNIIILSGKINSGKTTILQQMIKNGLHQYSGVLCPKIDGKRYAYLIHEKRELYLEAQSIENETQIIKVGRYIFNKAAIEEINQSIIENALEKERTVIIDEIGPLELKKSGFYDSVISVLGQKEQHNLSVIFVIREKLLEEAIRFFNLSPNKIFNENTMQEILNL